MRVEVINTDGLSKSVKSKIEQTMTFTRWWEEDDCMFCELKNSSGETIRIFPERVKPFHHPAELSDVKIVSRPTDSGGVMTERVSGKPFLPSVLTIPISYWVDDDGVRHIDYDLLREKYEEEMWKLRTLNVN